MSVRFAKNVKSWQRRQIRRWLRVNGLQDWTIEVESLSAEEIGEDIDGRCYAQPKYFTAHIEIFEELTDDERGRHAIAHEVRHCRYESLMEIFEHCWDGRRKLDRETARQLLRDEIEKLIEYDMQMLRRLKHLK